MNILTAPPRTGESGIFADARASRRRFLAHWVSGAAIAAAVVMGGLVWRKNTQRLTSHNAVVTASLIEISPSVSGRVIRVPAADHGQVQKGAVLVEIDPAPFDLEVKAAAAQLAAAKAKLALARQEAAAAQPALAAARTAVEGLQAQAAAPTGSGADAARKPGRAEEIADKLRRAQLEMARVRVPVLKLQAAQGALVAAESALQRANQRRTGCRVTAPFAGTVSGLTVKPGSFVRKGQPLGSLLDTQSWQVIAFFPETALSAIRPGMTAVVYPATASGLRMQGRVKSIAPVAADFQPQPSARQQHSGWVRQARRFPVVIDLGQKPPAAPLRHGASAVVRLMLTAPEPQTDAPAAPAGKSSAG